MGLKKYLAPGLVLLILSPVIGEMISGSSPPLEFFNPIGLVFLLLLYGGGAVIIRELALCWHKSWPSILVMGAAYGIVEEGLMVKSFFNPNWTDVGILGSYGRWLGINWAWTIELIIFHAVFSITIAILLVTLAYPERRSQPWVGRRTFYALCALLAATVVTGYFLLEPYPVQPALYLLALAGVIALMAIARWLPSPLFKPKAVKPPKPRWFAVIGLTWGTAFFAIAWIVPGTGIHPLIMILLMILSVAALAAALLKMTGNDTEWSDTHKLALAAGTLGFLVFLDLTLWMNGIFGMGAVGFLTVVALVIFYISVDRRVKSERSISGHIE
jgi:hypothetical protein